MLIVGRQHALIKQCALNNQVRLITRVYGTNIQELRTLPNTLLLILITLSSIVTANMGLYTLPHACIIEFNSQE